MAVVKLVRGVKTKDDLCGAVVAHLPTMRDARLEQKKTQLLDVYVMSLFPVSTTQGILVPEAIYVPACKCYVINWSSSRQVLDLTEEKAVEHFRAKFYEAVKNAWTTSLNWALHNIDKNNRQ